VTVLSSSEENGGIVATRLPKVLVLVLSAAGEPWNQIEELGQRQTFGQSGNENVDFIWYRGEAGSSANQSLDRVARVLNKWYAVVLWFNRVNVSGPRWFPGAGALSRWIARMGSDALRLHGAEIKDRILTVPVPERRSLIGLKTLLAFEYALENYDFDFVLRTNSSSYIDVQGLTDFVVNQPPKNFLGGVQGNFFGQKFTSGAAYLLSRDVVSALARSGASLWQHHVVDDVAMSIVVEELQLARSVPIERIILNDWEEAAETPAEEFEGVFHFRCKTGNASETIAIMKTLNERLAK
jgi:hypothetical protein